jgi:hypothetical protein
MSPWLERAASELTPSTEQGSCRNASTPFDGRKWATVRPITDNSEIAESQTGLGDEVLLGSRRRRAGDRTRTGDVQLGKLAFYQLNYARD